MLLFLHERERRMRHREEIYCCYSSFNCTIQKRETKKELWC